MCTSTGLVLQLKLTATAKAQITAFREWERVAGERFADLRDLRHPTLVVQGFHDEMIPVRNSYWQAEVPAHETKSKNAMFTS